MKQPVKKESGITFIGLVIVLAFIAMVVIFVLRLFPLYNEKFQIESAMKTVVSQPDAVSQNVADTRRAFLRALAITNINRFTDSNVKEHVNIIKPKKAGDPPLLHVQYQATNKLFADLQLLLAFDKQIPLNGGSRASGEN